MATRPTFMTDFTISCKFNKTGTKLTLHYGVGWTMGNCRELKKLTSGIFTFLVFNFRRKRVCALVSDWPAYRQSAHCRIWFSATRRNKMPMADVVHRPLFLFVYPATALPPAGPRADRLWCSCLFNKLSANPTINRADTTLDIFSLLFNSSASGLSILLVVAVVARLLTARSSSSALFTCFVMP